MEQSRDSHGRFKADHRKRNIAVAAAATVGALAAGVAAALRFGALDRFFRAGEGGHAAPDLAEDARRPGSGGRAPVDFRPDPTAPVTAAERDGLRPATGPGPSLTAANGSIASEDVPAIG